MGERRIPERKPVAETSTFEQGFNLIPSNHVGGFEVRSIQGCGEQRRGADLLLQKCTAALPSSEAPLLLRRHGNHMRLQQEPVLPHTLSRPKSVCGSIR